MPFDLLWKTYFLPVIQFLIGPIVVGVVVFYMTQKANLKKEKEKTIRQLNVHYSKIKRIIQLVESLNKELEEFNEYEVKINQMKNGDYSKVKEELRSVGNDNECLQLFVNLKGSSLKNMNKLQREINETSLELNDIPNDLLPPHIHAEIVELIESKQVDLDLVKHKKLLKGIKKTM